MTQIIPGSLGGILNGLILPIKTVNGNYTILSTDFTIEVNASLGAITITLPTAASQFDVIHSSGRLFNIKKIDPSANTVTIQPQGTDTIDELPNVVISALDVNIMIQSDGSRYVRL